MEMVILGLLMSNPQTLYQLNQSFQRSVSLFYSASYGSLKYALSSLLSQEYISVREVTDTARGKKEYAVTTKGTEALMNWLCEDFSDRKLEVASLSRLFLLGLVEGDEEKKRIIERIISRHTDALEQLKEVRAAVTRIPVPPNKSEIRRFKLKTLEYGIASYRSAIDWYESLLREMEEEGR